ncbi:IS66 family transposase [Endozoicomonas sp. 2B-B]
MFDEVELEGCTGEQDEAEGQPEQEPPKPRKKKTGRKSFSESLPRVQEPSELSEEKAEAIDSGHSCLHQDSSYDVG